MCAVTTIGRSTFNVRPLDSKDPHWGGADLPLSRQTVHRLRVPNSCLNGLAQFLEQDDSPELSDSELDPD
jgi:hypothetical protein